ncbi:hypothetical protein OPV22_009277 [Ensete ventricosum]|uniref:Uncharacterized protein n=1 Tax=Ensete ventricosum TaxID=4639 RepID=A0AAV8PZ17_ENSVE|nr:hypothetical protein OPV22_009277 [Ensete ventricosum]
MSVSDQLGNIFHFNMKTTENMTPHPCLARHATSLLNCCGRLSLLVQPLFVWLNRRPHYPTIFNRLSAAIASAFQQKTDRCIRSKG